MVRNRSRLIADESGATAIEYALIAALIAVIILSAILALGASMQTQFGVIATTTAGQGGP